MTDSDYNGHVELYLKALRPDQFTFDRVTMMNESDVTSFTPDLRVSAKPVIAVLVGAAVPGMRWRRTPLADRKARTAS